MALGLLPPLLDLMGLAESFVWRLSSVAAGLTFTVYVVTQFRRRRRVESGRTPLRVLINFTISIIAVVGLWLNAAGILFEPSLGPYAFALTWGLLGSGLIFLQTFKVFLHQPAAG